MVGVGKVLEMWNGGSQWKYRTCSEKRNLILSKLLIFVISPEIVNMWSNKQLLEKSLNGSSKFCNL